MSTSRRPRAPLTLACALAGLFAFAGSMMNQPTAFAQPDSAPAAQQTPIAISTTFAPITNATPRARLPMVMRAPAAPTPAPVPATRCTTAQPSILPGWFVYEARHGGVYGIAEMCNPLDRAIYIDYAFDALDGMGNVIESISDSAWHPVPAGGVMCAESVFYNRPAGAAQYRFRVRAWREASRFLDYGGAVIHSTYDPVEHTVTGTVRNQTGEKVYVGMAVALYDAGAQILQCDELPSINDSSLDPGQITSFRSRFFDYDPIVNGILERVTQHVVSLSQTP
jgi:hypothetical protein